MATAQCLGPPPRIAPARNNTSPPIRAQNEVLGRENNHAPGHLPAHHRDKILLKTQFFFTSTNRLLNYSKINMLMLTKRSIRTYESKTFRLRSGDVPSCG